MPRSSRTRTGAATLLPLLVLLVATGCKATPPPGDLRVQRLNATTTHALVFAQPGQASLAAPTASVAPHLRIRNVGEAGSVLRVTVTVPTGMGTSVGTRDLSAGQSVDVRLSATGASRDDLVRVSGAGREVVVPVRVVSDLDPVCDAASLGVSRASGTLPAGASMAERGPADTGIEVLVRYDAAVVRSAAVPEAARRQLTEGALAASGARLLRPGRLAEHDLVWLPDEADLDVLRRTPGVVHAVPNVSVHRLALPNDPRLADQWWALGFGAAQGWAVTSGSDADPDAPRVVVAIIDDSLNSDHEDLRDTVLPGCDVFDFDDDVRFTGVDHGSHVAGLAGAEGDNGRGIAGIAYGRQVQVLGVKVFPDDALGNGTLDAVARGLLWSAGRELYGLATNPNPADVINMSFGFGTDPGPFVAGFLQDLVDELQDGTGATVPVLVAAAGNRGVARVEYPARLDGVIAVGSVDHDFARSSFSNHSLGLDLMAAGGIGPAGGACGAAGLLSLAGRANQLACSAGTSMASPVVAGAVALLLLHEPSLRDDPAAVLSRLVDRAYRPGSWDAQAIAENGAGIVCLDALLDAGTSCASFGP